MSRAKKNEEIESASSEEEVPVKKTAAKKTPVKKTPAKPKAPPKKDVKKEPVKENSEDEFSDLEVEDDETVANAEPEVHDEVLIGASKTPNQPARQPKGPERRIDPATPIGELNVEQRINSLIDLASDTYNLPLKNRMLEVKREFTGKGKVNKPKQRNNQQSQQQFKQPPQNYNQGYRMQETPNRDDYQMRPGPPMYGNNGGRGGQQRGRNPNGGGNQQRGGNMQRQRPQGNESDIYEDN